MPEPASIPLQGDHSDVNENLKRFSRKVRGSDETEIDLRITYDEMGCLIGQARESVTYAMGDFELSEMIRAVKRRVFLTDLNRLSEISC